MKNNKIFLLICLILPLASCNQQKIKDLQKELSFKSERVAKLEGEVSYLKTANQSQIDVMSDLSIVSKTGAESIKKSLENMTEQYGQIQDLNNKIQAKDSLNLALVMNLKRSLTDVNDEDVQVEIRGGKVHVSISDKLLFRSGSAKLNSKAKRVLEKIASVINDHSTLDVMVEGHTDNQPMSNSCISDNWDLSVKRATSVVRTLADDHFVDPERLIAAGRAEYSPRDDNSTTQGRSVNRRTEIVILPQLDQFFKLMEDPEVRD